VARIDGDRRTHGTPWGIAPWIGLQPGLATVDATINSGKAAAQTISSSKEAI